jgi:phosphate-selective porin OprO/OprP
VNFRRFRNFQIKAGKFKIPFGQDQLTSSMNLDFVYRSRIGRQLAPGRDSGFMLHGRLFERGLRYEAGVFNHDGENADSQRNTPTGLRTLAGRITGSPEAFIRAPSWLKELEVGAAVTRGQVADGATSLKGRSVIGEDFFPPVNVSGLRQRQGVELNWRLGPLSLNSEYMTVREERKGQGLFQDDLPDLLGRGWYAGGTLELFDRRKNSSQAGSLRTLLPGISAGRVELAARYEQLRFGSEASGARPSRSPRAANVLGNSDRAITLGANWYANRWTKFQFNAIRETIEDPARTPIPGVQHYWMFVGRTQFSL